MAELTALLEILRTRLKTVYLLRARVSEEAHNPALKTEKENDDTAGGVVTGILFTHNKHCSTV